MWRTHTSTVSVSCEIQRLCLLVQDTQASSLKKKFFPLVSLKWQFWWCTHLIAIQTQRWAYTWGIFETCISWVWGTACNGVNEKQSIFHCAFGPRLLQAGMNKEVVGGVHNAPRLCSMSMLHIYAPRLRTRESSPCSARAQPSSVPSRAGSALLPFSHCKRILWDSPVKHSVPLVFLCGRK